MIPWALRSLLAVCLLLLLMRSDCFGQEDSQTASKQNNTAAVAQPESTLERVRDVPIVWLIGPYIPSSGPFLPLNNQQRAEVYVRQTFFTAGAYAERLFAAGIDQARGSPARWGGGMGGYGLRFGNRYGQFMIANTFHSVGNAALGYEPRYDFCRCTGFWPRTRHAIVRNFVTYDRTEHELRPAVPLYAGSFGAGMLSSVWLPGRRNPWAEGGYAALEQAGFGSAYNWVSEFAIDILHKVTHNRYPQTP